MDLFRTQERVIVFRTISGANGWEPAVESVIKVRGIASTSGNALDPKQELVVQSGAVRVFLSKAYRRNVAAVEIGSEIEVDGISYAVTKIDTRGVLPGKYPLRFEGVKK